MEYLNIALAVIAFLLLIVPKQKIAEFFFSFIPKVISKFSSNTTSINKLVS